MKIIKYKYKENDVYVNYDKIETFVIRNDNKIIVEFKDNTDDEYILEHTRKRDEFIDRFESWLCNDVTILDGLTMIGMV